MAKKPVAPKLADVVNSPEYKGMSDSVKQQIENALLESKGKPPLPKTSKKAISAEEILANPAMVKAVKEKIGEEAAEDFIKKADEKSKIDDTDKPIVVDKQNKVRKTKQKTRKQQELEQQENTQRSLKDFILGKGSKAFNKMFPQLGALMGGVYRGGDRSANNNTTAQTNTLSNASGTTAILSSIIDSQKTSVDILQQILTAIKATPRTPPPTTGQNQTPPPPASNQNQTPPASNQNQRSSTTPPVTGPRAQMNLGTAAATVAGGVAIAGAGYAAQQAISGSRQAEPIRNESGNWSRMGSDGQDFLVRYSSVDGKFTLNGREVDRETYARFRQLTLQRNQQDPRYARYLEEEQKGENPFFAESNAENRVNRERLREISELLQRVERLPLAPVPATTPAINAPQASQTSTTQPAATPAAAPGTEYDITTGMPIGAPAATPVVTPNATPVATPSPSATTEQSSNELTDQQKQFVDYFLRYNELQDNEEARSIAEYIVKRRNMPGSLPNIASRDLRILVFNELRRRADRMGGMLIDNKLVLPGRPLTAAQMSSIERAGVQHYPQYVIDQYNRQKSGNATPEPASETSTAATQQQIPEGATPVKSNDRVVGYMPEGGGPTVTFTDADRQTLEGARTQLTGSGSSATAAQPQQAQRVTEARTTENVNIQTFREKDPEGFQEFTDFVRNRQREIVREEIQKIPANADPVSASMYRTSIESQARSIAQQEGIERFKDRLNTAGARSSQTSINGNPITGPDATPVTPANNTTPTQPSGSIRMGREISESSRIETPSPAVSTSTTPTTNPAADQTENLATTSQRLDETKERITKAGTDVVAETEQRGIPTASITQRITNAQYKSAEKDDTIDATPLKSASQEAAEEDLRENRILNFKADEIFFKADKFEFEGGEEDEQDASKTTSNNAGGGGGGGADATPAPNTASTASTTAGGSSSSAGGANSPTVSTGSTTGGGADATAAPTDASSDTGGEGINGVTTGGDTTTTGDAAQTPTNPTATAGLNFAPGVDKRIKPGIADKVKDVQSGFGKGLSITSGYRDPARNARVGGASGSKHLTGDAVDIKFAGNQEDTINFIKAASAKGLGGIGVYGPGFVHIDTGAKRVWGPDYRAGSIPAWAKAALNDHMTGQITATPAGSSPTSGAAVAEASAQNDMSIRSPSSTPSVQPSNSGSANPVARSESSSSPIDPNNPGPLEPSDAGLRYARLFSMAA